MKTLPFLAALALAAVLPLAAQERRALPAGPLLRAPEETSAWQIDFRYGSGGPKAAKTKAHPDAARPDSVTTAPPQRIVLTRGPGLWHAAVETVDGHHRDQWSDGRVQLFQSDGMTDPLPVPKESDGTPFLPDYTPREFPDMGWVAADTYEATRKVANRECLAFRKGDMTVLVDAQTRFPVSWREGDEERTFTPLAAPAGPLTLPPAFAAAMKRLGDDRQRSEQLPPP